MLAGHLDHALLQCGDCSVTHLHGQVTTGHHDAVRCEQNFFELGNGFSALDLGDQTGLVVVLSGGHVAELARHFHIGRVFGETHGHVVRLEAHRSADVFHVFAGQGRRSQAAALFVDALVVGQLAAQLDGGVHLVADHRVHHDHDQTVIEQEHVAGFDFAGQ